MLTTIRVVSKSTIFSIQRPLSYQIADSLILPQPSTLLGTLAFCLSKAEFITANGIGDEYIKNIVSLVRKGLARIAVKPLTPVVSTPITLSRLRTLEWTSNTTRKKISSGEKLANVMIREYVAGIFVIYFLFVDEDIGEKSFKALLLMNRVGDTESLTSVATVEKMEFFGKEKSGLVNTYTPSDWISNVPERFFTSRLCNEDYAVHSFKNVKGKPTDIAKIKLKLFVNYSMDFYLPLTVEKTERGYLIYKPSSFLVETKEGFTIACFKTSLDEARIVVKEEWL